MLGIQEELKQLPDSPRFLGFNLRPEVLFQSQLWWSFLPGFFIFPCSLEGTITPWVSFFPRLEPGATLSPNSSAWASWVPGSDQRRKAVNPKSPATCRQTWPQPRDSQFEKLSRRFLEELAPLFMGLFEDKDKSQCPYYKCQVKPIRTVVSMQMTWVIGKEWFLLISYLSVFLNCSKQTHCECFPWSIINNVWTFSCYFWWKHFLFKIRSVTMNNGRKRKYKKRCGLVCVFKADQVWNIRANGFGKGNWIQNEDTVNYSLLIQCALFF